MSTSQAARPSGPARTAPSAVVVDDEQDLAEVVAGYLAREGFEVRCASDGVQAISTIRESEPDVVILDLGLPGMDGIEVCRSLRTFTDCYVIMLTARSEEIDKLIGLSVGADDYLTKPFSPRELVARVRTVLRRPRTGRSAGAPESLLRVGDLEIDPSSRDVTLGGDRLQLTRTEFDLLAHLARSPRRVFTREQLMEAVWGPGWGGDSQLVDVHIGHLRKKLGERAADANYIQTIRGVGYRMGEGR